MGRGLLPVRRWAAAVMLVVMGVACGSTASPASSSSAAVATGTPPPSAVRGVAAVALTASGPALHGPATLDPDPPFRSTCGPGTTQDANGTSTVNYTCDVYLIVAGTHYQLLVSKKAEAGDGTFHLTFPDDQGRLIPSSGTAYAMLGRPDDTLQVSANGGVVTLTIAMNAAGAGSSGGSYPPPDVVLSGTITLS